ncbi:hypothetical protein BJ138DRAFT_1106788 [Hygrophoropsis aurantiaca]|uniref:Uncharacterized protein n=1 Tax=Hygrophoropsis aurantiaca TaxID=72124 RepID=A0ACB7ZUE7_9AGAM|nr:hypothetical protein BJ138DRAFT_1106788 [Hygrophoropsis aurantiaca]
MPRCAGCSRNFPALDHANCGKCIKLSTANGADERGVIFVCFTTISDQPQCKTCGIVYAWLRGSCCDACTDNSDTGTPAREPADQATRQITLRMQEHQKAASQHRLNQRGHSLASATDVNRRVSALKKHTKTEEVDVEVTLWLYPPPDDSGNRGAAKKFNALASRVNFKTNETSDFMLDTIVMKVKHLYVSSPSHITPVSDYVVDQMFTRESVQFGVVKTAQSIYTLEDAHIRNNTVAGVIATLKRTRGMSDKDQKAGTLTLRVYAFEVQAADYDDDPSGLSAVRGLSITPRRKRKLSSSRFTSELLPSAKRYQSEFRSNRRSSAVSIEYEQHLFRRSTCSVDTYGEIQWDHDDKDEEIMVAKGWQKYSKGSQPRGGYLAKGWSKFAFRAHIGSQEYALFQCKPFGSTENCNSEDLVNETELLALCDYFMKSFYRRAGTYKARGIPKIKWNAEGVFIGKLLEPPPSAPKEGEDNRTFIYNIFLAAPLLQTGSGYSEVKFSGNTDIGNNRDPLGCAMDAFAHHVVVDSARTILISDLQGIVAPDGSATLFDPQAHT